MNPARSADNRKFLVPVVCTAALGVGCSMNSSTPMTAWGMKDVSMLQYRTDAGQCAVIAATGETNTGNSANTAGGIYGQNSAAPPRKPTGTEGAASTVPNAPASSDAATAQSTSGGTYSGIASSDFADRAATQQRTQEMAEQRARADALKSCLSGRGYTEFELTSQQRAELARLPEGSDERRDYLFKLGTDPSVLSNQAVKASAAPPAKN